MDVGHRHCLQSLEFLSTRAFPNSTPHMPNAAPCARPYACAYTCLYTLLADLSFLEIVFERLPHVPVHVLQRDHGSLAYVRVLEEYYSYIHSTILTCAWHQTRAHTHHTHAHTHCTHAHANPVVGRHVYRHVCRHAYTALDHTRRSMCSSAITAASCALAFSMQPSV